MYSFPCTQDVFPVLTDLCITLSTGPNRVTVPTMVNLCSSPSSLVFVKGRSVVTALTLPPNQQTTAARTIIVPNGWLLSLQTNPMGCTGGCRTVTSTIQFNEPPMFCRQSH